jgi:hypothetical protein
MKLIIILVLCSVVSLSSCNNNSGSSGNKMKRQAIDIAENYALNHLKDSKKAVNSSGLITISNDQKMIVINPEIISFGIINDDSIPDAIVSLDTFLGQYQTESEHLILINTEGKLVLSQVIESNMKVLGIKNGIITAEVPTHSRNSPLFNCPVCRDVVKYKFLKGDLVKIE